MRRSRPLLWLHGEVKSPPVSVEARLEAGFLLRQLQDGETPGLPACRPMPIIGKGCCELRVVDRELTWRVICLVELDAVVILEVFAKKTRATPQRIIESCRERLRRYRSVIED